MPAESLSVPVVVLGRPDPPGWRAGIEVVDLRQNQNQSADQTDGDDRYGEAHRHRHFGGLVRATAFVFLAAAARAGRVTSYS